VFFLRIKNSQYNTTASPLYQGHTLKSILSDSFLQVFIAFPDIFSGRNSLIGNGADCENDARLNREPVKKFQKWDRMGKPRRPHENPS
jgi:hypothetical protein